MRADRLLSILLLLQARRRTTRELAGLLEVSGRTVHRDLEALATAGIPVYATRGAQGGWHLPADYQTRLTGLGEAELHALLLAPPPRLVADLGLTDAAAMARAKLLAAAPAALREGAADLSARLHIDPSAWRRADERIPAMATLQAAVFAGRRLAVTYARADGEVRERVLDPLGLVAKGSAWYLVAAAEGEVRTYRAARVQAATLLDAPAARPPGFDLAAFWEASAGAFVARLPRYEVQALATPTAVPRLKLAGRYSRLERLDPPGPDGRHPVVMAFDTEAEALEALLGFGPDVELVAPAGLRAAIAARARATADFYASAALPTTAHTAPVALTTSDGAISS